MHARLKVLSNLNNSSVGESIGFFKNGDFDYHSLFGIGVSLILIAVYQWHVQFLLHYSLLRA